MRSIAFSIKGLLAAVTMTAVGLFALFNATPLWAGVVVWLTLLMFLTALLALACRPGPARAFWIGFAIFGWGYFVLVHTPLGGFDRSYPLPPHAALETLHNSVKREVEVEFPDFPAGSDTRVVGNARSFKVLATLPKKTSFYRIGHCLWAWLLALIGGFLARHFYLAQHRTADPPASPIS